MKYQIFITKYYPDFQLFFCVPITEVSTFPFIFPYFAIVTLSSVQTLQVSINTFGTKITQW